MKKVSVLVLGCDGMLGHMVYGYLKGTQNLDVLGTSRRTGEKGFLYFDAEKSVEEQLSGVKADYIINCIGVIKPFCKDDDYRGVVRAIRVNALFPHELAKYATKHGIKVLQIATDCVYSGMGGNHNEDATHDALDVYGKTKSLGEPFEGSIINIRCSIIGPEKDNGATSLLGWFLNNQQGAELKGFTHHRWNGVTTLTFAKLCAEIILGNKFDGIIAKRHTAHLVPADSVDKYGLLCIFKEVFKKDYVITPVNNVGSKVDRTLSTREDLFPFFEKKTVRAQMTELREYMDSRQNAD